MIQCLKLYSSLKMALRTRHLFHLMLSREKTKTKNYICSNAGLLMIFKKLNLNLNPVLRCEFYVVIISVAPVS